MAASKMKLGDYIGQVETYERLLASASEGDKVRFTNMLLAVKKRRDDYIADQYTKRRHKLELEVHKISGLDLNTWWQQMLKLYTITPAFDVISNAKDWKEEKKWECNSEIDCQEKILVLMTQKDRDRKRGHGTYEQDKRRLEKLSKR